MTDKTILLTSTEVADYLNVGRSAISQRISRNEMPEPDAYTYKMRPLWKAETVEYLKNEIVPRKSKN